MPGWPVFTPVSAPTMTNTNTDNKERKAAASTGTLFGPNTVSFYVWLVVIGVVIPALILGGLRVSKFQFVFKGR